MLKRDTKFLMATVAGLVLISSLACGNLGDLDLPSYSGSNTSSCSGDVGDLSGSWTITGSGTREDCAKESLNTSTLVIESGALPIAHTVDTGAFELVGSFNGFTFVGQPVNGKCVEFETREDVGDQSMNFTWSGKAQTDRRIEGEFSTSGPSGCSGSGTFEMVRE